MTDLLVAQTAMRWPDVSQSLAGPFWQGCDLRQLWFVSCASCGAADFPPATHCRSCLSESLEWKQSSGLATLYSWTVVWRAPTPDLQTPYAPAIVDLDEGYRMLTNLVGMRIDDLAIGMRLAVEFVPVGGDHLLPCFTRA
jgi:uncharacterized OB-fold protein